MIPTDHVLLDALTTRLPAGSFSCSLADRLLWAEDASIYRLVPRAVVFPPSPAEVQMVLALAGELGIPVCFRAGGTSLSGQAVTDGILIVVSRDWRKIDVLDQGARVRCQPGAVGAWVNAALAPHGRRIGPDPASIQAAEIGGIVANNASGMCCGVHENSYRTITGLELILADGYRLDTGAADGDDRLNRDRPALWQGLTHLRDRVRADGPLAARITTAFQTKNTVGYGLNAFLDADAPAAILQKLVIGSEGTLAFIAAATFRTVPLPKHRATAFLLFPDIATAGRAVAPLADLGAAAVELLDATSLRRVADKLDAPLPFGDPAVLLTEFQEEDPFVLGDRLVAARPVLAGLGLARPVEFTTDPNLQSRWWAVRKGLFPSVGAVRAAGTAVVIEDVTFPVAHLADGVLALRALFHRHGYQDQAVIFGHAKDGNLHFTLTPDLSQEAEVVRYRAFMNDLAEVVLAAGGHLKAEHGTGRNMAPFVVRQWGADAVAVMRAVKTLLDPGNLLNPGVLLADDPEGHLKHLKRLAPADPLIDRCISCGFCEPACPSRDAAMSPRQRITGLRLLRGGTPEEITAISQVWAPTGLDTCAGDGLCATACPVGIDTGNLVRAERAVRRPPWARFAARLTLRHFALVVDAARGVLDVAAGVRLPGRRIPIPGAAPTLPRRWPVGSPTFAYLPTCVTRMIGPDSVPEALATLGRIHGFGLEIPGGIAGLCCGQAFASKGFPEAAATAKTATVRAILALGRSQVIIDTSTCAGFLLGPAGLPPELIAPWAAMTVLSPAQFARLLPPGRGAGLALHPTCSDQRHGWTGDLQAALPGAELPASVGCCGMAGDKGWSTPRLTDAACAREASEVSAGDARAGVTTGTTCGHALAAATGLPYRHVFTVLAEP